MDTLDTGLPSRYWIGKDPLVLENRGKDLVAGAQLECEPLIELQVSWKKKLYSRDLQRRNLVSSGTKASPPGVICWKVWK